jgi:hypothetical protein
LWQAFLQNRAASPRFQLRASDDAFTGRFRASEGFNLGVGYGFTRLADAWTTIKAIVDVPEEELWKR